jgi:Tol biopolymer transport system component
MNSDGGGQTAATDTPSIDEGGPAWSPDMSKIAFERRGNEAELRYIFSMNFDGSAVTNLTSGIEGDANGTIWSPDARKISFNTEIGTGGMTFVSP